MLSFHNQQSIKDKYINRVLAHRIDDNIIQGIGWEKGKGCAVGCTLENYDHSRYPIELGLPEWLAHLEDNIFEALPNEAAKNWPLQFLQAIPVGIPEEHFEKVGDFDGQRQSLSTYYLSLRFRLWTNPVVVAYCITQILKFLTHLDNY